MLSILQVKVVSGSSFSTPVNVEKVCCKILLPSSSMISSPSVSSIIEWPKLGWKVPVILSLF